MEVGAFSEREEPNECANDDDTECVRNKSPVKDYKTNGDVVRLDDSADR